MKTNHLLQICAATIMLLLASCGPKKQDCKNCPNNVTVPDGTFCYKDNGRPDKMLKYQEIVTMLKEYDSKQKVALEEAIGKVDTRTNFYTIKELKDYLAYVEALCKEKEIKLTGIKMISAAYPEEYKLKPEYSGKQTLILMPTTQIDGEDITFDPLQSEKKHPVTFRSILEKYDYQWPYDPKVKMKTKKVNEGSLLSIDFQQDIESSGLNRGTLAPPPPY